MGLYIAKADDSIIYYSRDIEQRIKRHSRLYFIAVDPIYMMLKAGLTFSQNCTSKSWNITCYPLRSLHVPHPDSAPRRFN